MRLTPRGSPLLLVVPLIVLLVLLRVVVWQPFNVPAGSMVPTLPIGSEFIVFKPAYMLAEPEPGDIAVFKKPPEGRETFVKRIVGLPGDRVQIIDGVLTINGAAARRERIVDSPSDPGNGVFIDSPQYIETLNNGHRYRIVEEFGDTGPLDNTREFIVPDGHYFAMGDNRDRSADSRQGWFVPDENLIGRALVIFRTEGEWTWIRLDGEGGQ